MSPMLLVAAFTIHTAQVQSFLSNSVAASVVSQQLQTGSLIVSKGECLAVKIYTRSPYTHVAAVVVRGETAWVYDSFNGDGVRRQPLEDYLASMNPDVFFVLNPAKSFSRNQGRVWFRHLDRQLGRPYAVRHHLTGGRCNGLHCAEYVTDALMACNLIDAKKPSRVSPASLAQGLLSSGLYTAAVTVHIAPPDDFEEADSLCEFLWIGTKVCTRRCFDKLRRTVFCR